ncbi:MAG: ATP-binding protein [Ferruginibacter sp.]
MNNPSTEAVIIFLVVATSIILLMAIFVAFTIFQHQQKQNLYKKNIEELKAAHDKELLHAQLEIQENTLQHISREIHDNIGLSLTLAKLNLNTFDIREKNKALEKIDLCIELLTNSIHDLASLGKSFNAGYIAENGLIKAVQNELDNIKRTGTIASRLSITGNPLFMDSQKELLLFRIVQEALNNIIKHSAAKTLNIVLHYTSSHIQVKVSDDGKGLPDEKCPAKKMGSGLSNMQQRAKMVNGECEIKNNSSAGTTVFINIPY